MKKEYVKPTLLVLATEPSQIMATSPGEGGLDVETDNGPDYGGEDLPPTTKGNLWDDFSWNSLDEEE